MAGDIRERLRLLLDDLHESEYPSEDGLRIIFERHRLNNKYCGDKILVQTCLTERLSEEIIRCLLEYFPGAAATNRVVWSPLHLACYNESTTRGIIQLLIDAAPDSVRNVPDDGNMGHMPLHTLCSNDRINQTSAVEIAELLIKKHPEAVRHKTNAGNLPIHIAAQRQSPEFCQVLIEAYPGSKRISDSNGVLPLHHACCYNEIASVECLFKLYPDAINHATPNGKYPIHYAIAGLRKRASPEGVIEVVQYLLDCDPNVKLQKFQGISLLHVACRGGYNDSNIDAALEMIKTFYDAHPEAIEDDGIVLGIQRYQQRVQRFINSELAYARQARDHRRMMAPDDNGRLPLHNALLANVRLGSIKLLVKGNPTALQSPDNGGALPLHIACEHQDSISVVEYLVELDTSALVAVDNEGNTALHYACRSARHEIITLLLGKAVSVSMRNATGKLPINLLWESNSVGDRESVDYTESVFRLLKAYLETV